MIVKNIFNVKRTTLALMLTSIGCALTPEAVLASAPSAAETTCLNALTPLLPNECKTASSMPKYSSTDGNLSLTCTPIGVTVPVAFSVPGLCQPDGTLSSSPVSFSLNVAAGSNLVSLAVNTGNSSSTYRAVNAVVPADNGTAAVGMNAPAPAPSPSPAVVGTNVPAGSGAAAVATNVLLPSNLPGGCTAAFDNAQQQKIIMSCPGANGAPAIVLTFPSH